jgi:hypothetical protein
MNNYVKVLTGLAICASASAYASGDYMPSYAKAGFVVGVEGGYGFLNTPNPTYPKDFTYQINPDTIYGVTIPGLRATYEKTNDIGSFMWGVHAGYDFLTGPHSLVGLELGYKDLGQSKYSNELYLHELHAALTGGGSHPTLDISRKIDQQALDLLLTYHYFVYQGFNVFAKAGVADVYSTTDQDFDVKHVDEIHALEGKESIWRFEPEMQLGAGYMFAQHVNVYAYYDHIGDGSDTGNVVDHLTQAKVYGSNSLWAGISYTF